MITSRLLAVAGLTALAAPAARAQRAQRADATRPGRLSAELSMLGGALPTALRAGSGCGGSNGAAMGLAVGAGYRLTGPLRAEARLGAFEQPSAFTGADCVYAADAPLPFRTPGTVERSTGFDPRLPDRRAFTQGRLVADVPARDRVLRASVGGGTLLRIRAPFVSAGAGFGGRVAGGHLLLEAERWWMRAPTLDRTVTWEALPVPAGTPAGYVPTRATVTTERRGARGLQATWLRLSATLPLPGS